MEAVRRMLATLVSHTEVVLCPGKQKHATTVYHVIWAELSEDTLTVSFVETKKKSLTVCIKARLLDSTKEEAVEWVEDLMNVAYKGAILTLSLWTDEISNLGYTRYQAQQEVEGVRESVLRQGDVAFPVSARVLRSPPVESKLGCRVLTPDQLTTLVPNLTGRERQTL